MATPLAPDRVRWRLLAALPLVRISPAPRHIVWATVGLLVAYASGWAGLELLAQFSRRAAETLPWYLNLPWRLPTILVGLALLGLCGVHVGLVPGRRVRSGVWGLLLMGVSGLWAARLLDVYSTGGLFAGLGLDFGLYWAQGSVLLHDPRPGAIYDTSALEQAMVPLAAYARSGAGGLIASPVAYPPVFAWLLGPLTRVEPPVALGLWTAVNASASVWLAWRVGGFFEGRTRLLASAVCLTSVPVMMALALGQPVVLLACALGEFYLSLAAGRQVRAGLWLSLLAFKPMYGLFLGPFLLWKRQWKAAGAAMAGVALLLLASMMSVGPAAFLSYPAAVSGLSAFYGEPLTFPSLMINWRSLVVTVFPQAPTEVGLWLTLLLGTATVATTAWALRGSFSPQASDYPARMTAITLVTLLANYHSNVHGAALLAVPLAALIASRQSHQLTRYLMAALLMVPFATLFDVVLTAVSGRAAWPPLQWAPLAPLLLGGVLYGVVRDWRRRSALVVRRVDAPDAVGVGARGASLVGQSVEGGPVA